MSGGAAVSQGDPATGSLGGSPARTLSVAALARSTRCVAATGSDESTLPELPGPIYGEGEHVVRNRDRSDTGGAAMTDPMAVRVGLRRRSRPFAPGDPRQGGRRSRSRRLGVQLLVAALFLSGCPGAQAKAKKLLILHTTDEHSQIVGFGPEIDDHPAVSAPGGGMIKGGIGRRATLVAQQRAAAKAMGGDSILVSAGDSTMGSLMQADFVSGAPDFQLMRALGYDATTLGDHEFDFGPQALAASLQAANAGLGLSPTVSTNIHFSPTDVADDTLAALYDEDGSDGSKLVHKSWTMTTPSGIKIGFVGICGPNAASAANMSPVTFSVPTAQTKDNPVDSDLAQVYADVQPTVDRLRQLDKVDLVIALSHSGLDPANVTTSEDYKIAQNISGLDVIISGHTHRNVDAFSVVNTTTRKPVIIQQAGRLGETLGRLAITITKGVVSLDASHSSLLTVDDNVGSDPAIDAKISAAIASVEKLPSVASSIAHITGVNVTDDTGKDGELYFYPVGSTDFTVVGKAEMSQAPLTDLLADAELAAVRAEPWQEVGALKHDPVEVSLVAQGQLSPLRADLDKGKTGTISFADVFRTVASGDAVPRSYGASLDGSFGSPLCHFDMQIILLKKAFELWAGYNPSSPEYAGVFLTGGGIQVEYDTDRLPYQAADFLNPDNGRVTKMTLASDPAIPDVFDRVIFDISAGGYIGNFSSSISVAANLWVTKLLFQSVTGFNLLRAYEAIVRRADGSEIKEWEALAGYIHSQPNMTVPPRYITPSHMVCKGSLCK